MYGLLIGFFLGFVLFFIKYNLETKPYHFFIGEKALNLLKSSAETQFVLFYIDQSAKYSAYKTMHKLGENGGFSYSSSDSLYGSESDCGKFGNYQIWYDGKYCFPENYNENFAYFMNDYLDDYFSQVPEYSIPQGNYEIQLVQQDNKLKILGNAAEDIGAEIIAEGADKIEHLKKEVSTKCGIMELVNIPADIPCTAEYKPCRLTPNAASLIAEAQKDFDSKEYDLVVTSSYRSYEQQQELYNDYITGKSKVEAAKPSCAPEPSPHLTGSAVDVCIKKKDQASCTIYSMTNDEIELLRQIMCGHGFVNYKNEPWHYECCGTLRTSRAKEGQCLVG